MDNRQALFDQGVALAETKFAADCRDYDRVLCGLGAILTARGYQAKSEHGPHMDLGHVFHDPLASANPRMPVEQIVLWMENILRGSLEPAHIPLNIKNCLRREVSWLYRSQNLQSDDPGVLAKLISDMKADLKPISSPSDYRTGAILESARYHVDEWVAGRVTILSLLGGDPALIEAAQAHIEAVSVGADYIRQYALWALQAAEQRLADLPKIRAGQMLPLESLTTNIIKGWKGNCLEPGEFLADGYMLIRVSAMKRAKAKQLAEKDSPRGSGRPQNAANDIFAAASRNATPARICGYRKITPFRDSANQVYEEVAYLMDANGRILYADVHKLALLDSHVTFDRIMVAAGDGALAFWYEDQIVALLMPIRNIPDREWIAPEGLPPTMPTRCPECGSKKITPADTEGLNDCPECGIWFDPTDPNNAAAFGPARVFPLVAA